MQNLKKPCEKCVRSEICRVKQYLEGPVFQERVDHSEKLEFTCEQYSPKQENDV